MGGYVRGQMPKNANIICEGSLIKQYNIWKTTYFSLFGGMIGHMITFTTFLGFLMENKIVGNPYICNYLKSPDYNFLKFCAFRTLYNCHIFSLLPIAQGNC